MKGDSVQLNYSETIWIELNLTNDTISSATGYYKESSNYKHELEAFLNKRILGFGFNTKMEGKILIPLLIGRYTKDNYEQIMRDIKLLETLRTESPEKARNSGIIVYPISVVLGVYSPPHKLRN